MHFGHCCCCCASLKSCDKRPTVTLLIGQEQSSPPSVHPSVRPSKTRSHLYLYMVLFSFPFVKTTGCVFSSSSSSSHFVSAQYHILLPLGASRPAGATTQLRALWIFIMRMLLCSGCDASRSAVYRRTVHSSWCVRHWFASHPPSFARETAHNFCLTVCV